MNRARRNPKFTIEDHNDRIVEVVDAEEIGKGMFKRVFKSKKRRKDGRPIVAISSPDNYDHEILASVCREYRSQHVPCTEFVGYVGDERVYTMKYYKSPLRKADSPRAWRQYQQLKKARDEASREWGYRQDMYDGHKYMDKTIEIFKRNGGSQALVRALETINRHVKNYGPTYRWEFTPRNLATDRRGNLILLDPFFDQEQQRKVRHAWAHGDGR